jgi:hypothetical protein
MVFASLFRPKNAEKSWFYAKKSFFSLFSLNIHHHVDDDCDVY